MNQRWLDLATRRGLLQAQIAAQREALAQHSEPLAAALGVGDKGLAGIDWLKRHPLAVGVAAGLLAVLRPRRTWRWAQRGFVVWRGWKSLQNTLSGGR